MATHQFSAQYLVMRFELLLPPVNINAAQTAKHQFNMRTNHSAPGRVLLNRTHVKSNHTV